MRTGALEGNIAGIWQVVHDSGELAAAVTSYSITGLNGDVDLEYRLISRVVNGYNGACDCYIQPNSINGASDYGYQLLNGIDSSVSSSRGTASIMRIGSADAISKISFSDLLLHAKSGTVRTAFSKNAENITGTTVGAISLFGDSLNESVTNITSLLVIAGQASGIGIGSRFILLKKMPDVGMRTGELNVQGKVEGAWQEVYRTTLAAAATSVTISGLTGNTDVLYRVRMRAINAYNGDCRAVIRFNADSGSNYGYQQLYGSSTTAGASRNVGAGINNVMDTASLNQLSHYEALIFAKSGFVRTILSEVAGEISGTTVGLSRLFGESWNNANDEITTIAVVANQSNGLGIGTEIVIERLNL